MTARSFGGIELSRAAPAPAPGPLDDRLYDLVEARFRNVAESEPTWATQLGIHAWDDRLPDPSRERLLGDVERDKAHLAAIEALDDAGLEHLTRVCVGAPHGYTMADTPAYDEGAAEWHYAALADLFSKSLAGRSPDR